MKKLKILLFMPMLFALVACSDDSVTTSSGGGNVDPVFNVIGIEFVDDNITIDKLSGVNSGAFVTPNYISDQRITFVSDDPSIAVGDNETGAIIGLSEGTTTIRVSSATYAGASNVMTVNVTATEGNGYFVANNGIWLIMNRNGMEKFRDNVTIDGNARTSARLILDIELDNTTSWTPIGSGPGYSGVFDGNNKSISGLYIADSTDIQGLFHTISYIGEVKNLTIIEPNISAREYVGAVAGQTYGTIENVHVKGGTVLGLSSVGGISGYSESTASITYSSNSAKVTRNPDSLYANEEGSNYGGIVGNNYGDILACWNTGDVDGVFAADVGGSTRIGGIAGYNVGSIYASYNTSTITGGKSRPSGAYEEVEYFIGGIVGYYTNSDRSADNIVASYNLGNVVFEKGVSRTDVGALVGWFQIPAGVGVPVEALYYLSNTSVNSGINGNYHYTNNMTEVTDISSLNSPSAIEELNNALGSDRQYEFKAGIGEQPPYVVKVKN